MNKMVISPKNDNVGVKINTKKFTDKQEFLCSADDLYRSLTDRNVSVYVSSNLIVFINFWNCCLTRRV